MRQDTDVARMAAALRTPSLKYRSFGNEAVRNPIPPAPPATEQEFSILGDALAGANDLPPDIVMGGPAPVPTETPMLPVREAESVPPARPASFVPPAAPDPFVAIERRPAPVPPIVPSEPPPQEIVPVVPVQAYTPPPPPPVAAPVVPPVVPPHLPAAEPPASSLLQLLLGNQAPQPAPLPPPPPMTPPPALAPAPMVSQSLPMPILASLPAMAPSWSPPRGGTGSSLLDTLMGVGETTGASQIHYPLLDALGDAMRGTTAEPSPRLWPAARVDIALPELLRRVAAGVRFARPAA